MSLLKMVQVYPQAWISASEEAAYNGGFHDAPNSPAAARPAEAARPPPKAARSLLCGPKGHVRRRLAAFGVTGARALPCAGRAARRATGRARGDNEAIHGKRCLRGPCVKAGLYVPRPARPPRRRLQIISVWPGGPRSKTLAAFVAAGAESSKTRHDARPPPKAACH